IVCADSAALAEVIDRVPMVPDDAAALASGDLVTLRVTYDGPDLSAVAAATGQSVEAVVQRHMSAEYVVGFCGFAPGFAYLIGLPAELWLPRRDDPRVRVPSGSVAISAEYSAVYP